MAHPRVVGIYTATAAGEPLVSHPTVEVQAGLGIPGDRYATGQGHWSDPRWPDQQLTLVESELLAEIGLSQDALRRNLVTAGLDLATLIGVRFELGTALLEGVRPCEPCRYIESQTRRGLFTELAGRGGLRANVLRSGRISLNDEIRPLAERQSASQARSVNP